MEDRNMALPGLTGAVSPDTRERVVLPVPLDKLLRPEQVAEVLDVSRNKVYELMAAGQLRSLKIGRARRVTIVALQDFIANCGSV